MVAPAKAAATRLPWSVSQIQDQVHQLDFTFDKVGDKRYLLLLSDLHWDSVKCQRRLLRRDLSEAIKRNAAICVFGDLFDIMQGKKDPRSTKSDLRPELGKSEYYDECVDQAAKWFEPFASHIALLTPGNHETKITSHCETDVLARLTKQLRQTNPTIQSGKYWGFVRLTASAYNRQIENKSLYYHHGYGGGGEHTRGLLDNARTRSQYQADFYVSGHIHRRNYDENVQYHITPLGHLRKRMQRFMRSGSYKDDNSGWHSEKGHAARPLGGWWVELEYTKVDSRHHCRWRCIPTDSDRLFTK